MASFRTVLIPANDIAASRDLYRELLGVEPGVDQPYYVGFDVEGQHIGLVPGTTALRAHLHVEDLDDAVKRVVAAGGSVIDAAKEVGGGRLVAVVRDPAGAELGMIADPAQPEHLQA